MKTLNRLPPKLPAGTAVALTFTYPRGSEVFVEMKLEEALIRLARGPIDLLPEPVNPKNNIWIMPRGKYVDEKIRIYASQNLGLFKGFI